LASTTICEKWCFLYEERANGDTYIGVTFGLSELQTQVELYKWKFYLTLAEIEFGRKLLTPSAKTIKT